VVTNGGHTTERAFGNGWSVVLRDAG